MTDSDALRVPCAWCKDLQFKAVAGSSNDKYSLGLMTHESSKNNYEGNLIHSSKLSLYCFQCILMKLGISHQAGLIYLLCYTFQNYDG